MESQSIRCTGPAPVIPGGENMDQFRFIDRQLVYDPCSKIIEAIEGAIIGDRSVRIISDHHPMVLHISGSIADNPPEHLTDDRGPGRITLINLINDPCSPDSSCHMSGMCSRVRSCSTDHPTRKIKMGLKITIITYTNHNPLTGQCPPPHAQRGF